MAQGGFDDVNDPTCAGTLAPRGARRDQRETEAKRQSVCELRCDPAEEDSAAETGGKVATHFGKEFFVRRDKNGNTRWLSQMQIIFKLVKAVVKGRVLQTDQYDAIIGLKGPDDSESDSESEDQSDVEDENEDSDEEKG